MKSCPTCQRNYTDDGQIFCLEDGATLIVSPLTGAYEAVTTPLRGPRETSPPATEVFTAPSAPPPGFHPSAPVAKNRAGLGLGVVALLLAGLSLVMMLLGFAGAAADANSSAVGGLIVGTFIVSLLGAAVGLVGILRAVRNDAKKTWPLLGFLANALYLLFIIILLVLGIAVSKK